MRLTLRTLLAYLDGVLDRQDAEAMKAKVAESETAKQLAARIEEVTHRREIEPVRIDARTHSADPNAMADYLDGMMPSSQVASHEKGCLDSDALLAEAAASHQILSRVLREPAKVTERFRNRLTRRALEELERSTPVGTTDMTVQYREDQAHDVVVQATRESAPKGPIASESGLEGLPVLKPRENRQPLASGNGARFLDEPHSAGLLKSDPPQSPQAQLRQDEKQSPQASARFADRLPIIVAVGSLLIFGTLVVLAIRGDLNRWLRGSAPIVAANGEDAPESISSEEASSAANEGTSSVASEYASDESQSFSEPAIDQSGTPPIDATPVSTEPSNPSATAGGATDSSPVMLSNGAAEIAAAEQAAQPPMTEPTPEPAPSPAAGITWAYDESAGLAVYFAPSAADWQFLSKSDSLAIGGFVQSMPVDQTRLSTNTGMQVELLGATQVALSESAPRGAASTAVLDLTYGRIKVTHPQPNQRFEVLIGTSRWSLDLIEAGSTAVIERRPWLMPNENWSLAPAESDQPRHEIVQVIVSNGQVNLSDGSAIKTLSAPYAIAWFDGESVSEGSFEISPTWLVETDALSIAARSATVAAMDASASSPTATWQALLTHERPEVRVTAIESLSELGLYDGVWETLSNPSLPANWRRRLASSVLEQLRRAEGRAARFKDAAPESELGQLALDLWTMPTEEVLAAGGGARLVELLEHRELMIRFLAFEQLLSVTGSTELYMPEADQGRRARGVQAWKTRLAGQGISYSKPLQLPIVEVIQ